MTTATEADRGGDYEQRIDEVLAAYLVAREQGGAPTPAELFRQYPDLAADLERFLAGHDQFDRLTAPLKGIVTSEVSFKGTERYAVIRQLGQGGFGVVYLARDTLLGRDVALKVPRSMALLDAAGRRRFHHEARIAAHLDHPHIVPVYEVGEYGAVPFIVAAYCPGPSLGAWLRAQTRSVPPREAARLVALLADAVQHAHDRGVLHRDLKPGNVLLMENQEPRTGTWDERKSTSSSLLVTPHSLPATPYSLLLTSHSLVPKITDYGLAHLSDGVPGDTLSHSLLGTPAYMSPEQARGRVKDLGPAADIYGLGAILYELLTGRPPFRGASDADTLRQVVGDEPVSLRRVQGDVPADLEAVCLRCLEKDPARRYVSAEALAGDLRRFVEGRPTAARPIRLFGRGLRWARRRPDLAGLSAITTLAVVGAVVVAAWLSRGLAVSRAETNAAGRLAATQEYFAVFERIRQRQAEPQPGWADESLTDLRRVAQLPPAAEHLPELRSEAAATLAGIDLRHVGTLPHEFDVFAIAFTPDGRSLALGEWGSKDGVSRVRLVDPTDGRTVRELTFSVDETRAKQGGMTAGCRDLVFSPDGRWLVASSPFGWLHRWDLSRGESQAVSWQGDPGAEGGGRLTFGKARPLLFIHLNGCLKCWDAADGWKPQTFVVVGITERAVVNPTSDQIAFVAGGKLHLRDGHTFESVRPPFSLLGNNIAFSPDGHTVAVIDRSGRGVIAWLYDVESGQTSRPLTVPGGVQSGEADNITELAFSPDGVLLAAASEWSRHVTLWDVAGNQLAADRIAGTAGSMRIAFRPGGRTLAVAADRTVSLFDVMGQQVCTSLAIQPLPVRGAALGPDGRSLVYLVTTGDDRPNLGVVCWWPGGPILGSPSLSGVANRTGYRATVAVDPLGRGIVYDAERGGKNGVESWVLSGGDRREFQELDSVKQVRFSPDGSLWTAGKEVLAFALPGWRVTGRWANGREDEQAGRVFYSVAPGRAWVLAGRRDGLVFLLDPAARHKATWTVGNLPVSALEIDEAAGLAVAGDEQGRVKVFRVPSGEVMADLPHAHRDAVEAAAIAPSGQLLATGGRDRTIRLWRTDGTPILTFRATAPVTMLAFTPDGQDLIALAAGERGLRRWRQLGRLAMRLRELGIEPGF